MNDQEQIEKIIESLHICSQSLSCENCEFKTMKDVYEQEAGQSDFTCRSALMDSAAELLGYLIPVSGKTRRRKKNEA